MCKFSHRPRQETGFRKDCRELGSCCGRVYVPLLIIYRDDAVETDIADLYKSDRAAFEKTAKQWVKSYAKDK